jgi:hypothetical protein|tara:strand:+ start:444 stop:1160 length:717 start_codon:yes stop_codon:yes gene_type:complete
MLGLGHSVSGEAVSLVNIFNNRWALTFNGTDESVQINAVGNDMAPAEKGTISIWAIMEATSGSAFLMKAKVDSSNEIFMFWHNASDEIRMTHKAGGTGRKTQWDATDLNHSAWNHFVMTWDNTADELKSYLNGTQIGSTVGSLGDWSGTISTVHLGQNTADGAFFKGRMDEVSIWKDVMDVSMLYNGGAHRNVEFSGLDSTKLVGYYRMEEGAGTTTADASETGNTGTLVNTPTWTAY